MLRTAKTFWEKASTRKQTTYYTLQTSMQLKTRSAIFNFIKIRFWIVIFENLWICSFWPKFQGLILIDAKSVSVEWQRENTLRDSLQKFITLHKARSVHISLRLVQNACRNWATAPGVTPRGPSMPKNLKKVQIYLNPVITLLEVNSLTFHNLYLCKAARSAQIKEKIEILVL